MIRAPLVAARDVPPDPTAPGPSAQDIEDWYAGNGWKVFEFREDNPHMADVGPCPLETAEASLRGGSGFTYHRRTGGLTLPRRADDDAGNGEPFLNTNDNVPPDPPASGRTKPGKYTYGIEFEFLLAPTAPDKSIGDPHPNDDRWFSHNMAGGPTSDEYETTISNRVTDAMRRGDVVTNRIVSASYGQATGPPTARPWWLFSYEDDVNAAVAAAEAANHNALIPSWMPPILFWNPTEDENGNVRAAVQELLQFFEAAHVSRGIQLRETGLDTVEEIGLRWLSSGGIGRLQGAAWTPRVQYQLQHHWKQKAIERINEVLTEWETQQRDPNHVDIEGMSDSYRAWQSTDDVSVSIALVRFENYVMPPGYVVPPWSARQPIPPYLYSWYGTEVISPVYDIANPDCYATVERALKQMRNELRIHKPLSTGQTGLHIHMGHQDGWNLFQLKRVVTLYYLLEPELVRLHREERETFLYCRPMRTQSFLAGALFYPEGVSAEYQYRLPGGGALMNLQYDQYMAPLLPLDIMDENTRKFITAIWRYPTITNLTQGLSNCKMSGSEALRIGMFGDKRTEDPGYIQKQTLEFRHMQGTLDAIHV